MNDITNTNPNTVGQVDDFADVLIKSIDQSRSTMSVGDSGKPILRLLRNGIWVYGQNNEEVQQGSQWAVDLRTLSHGWVCWGDGELLGQVMVRLNMTLPEQPSAIDNYPFVPQYGFELKCLSGEDEGTLVIYKNNSRGFRIAFADLKDRVYAQATVDRQFYWPIITLGESSYPHKKYGEIFEPVLTIVAWTDINGNLKGTNAPKIAAAHSYPSPKPAPQPAPARVRKSSLVPETPPAAPVSTQQAHVGQRRRPAS